MQPFHLQKICVLLLDETELVRPVMEEHLQHIIQLDWVSSHAQAVSILEKKVVHVIVYVCNTDDANGAMAVHAYSSGYPNVKFLLIDAKPSIASFQTYVNKLRITQYLVWPADETVLLECIEKCFDAYRTEADIKKQLTSFQRSTEELNRFVYSTSHDLRGPIASVLAILNLINLDKSVTDPNNYMALIDSCVRKMDVYVQKIVEYYKSVRVKEEPEPIDLQVFIEDCINHVRFQNTNVTFHVHVQQKTVFKADAFRLSVIINNLVSNAVKYQRPEEPDQFVKIQVEATEEEAKISISDNGIGIIDENINKIFDMFFRGQVAAKGMGIGLYIVKEALQKMSGEIEVKSLPNLGSQFTLSIPNRAFVD
jgi:two-component system, sensor histidine kinase and response regulator